MQTNHEIIRNDRQTQLYYAAVRSSNDFLPAHWHEHLEILHILEGSMTAFAADRTFHLRKGDIFIANPGIIHNTHTGKDCAYDLLQIPPTHLQRIGSDWQDLYFPEYLPFHEVSGDPEDSKSPASQIAALLARIRSLQTAQPAPERASLLILSSVYDLLFQLCCSVRTGSHPQPGSRRDLERIELVMGYVQEHYAEPVSLSQAADMLSVTPSHFCRLFKKYTGQTFLGYISQLRLIHFHQDLLQTEQPIAFLLDQNGITNYKVFLKAFRKAYGVSPQQLRQNAGKAATSETV